jgi:hypothetical protein
LRAKLITSIRSFSARSFFVTPIFYTAAFLGGGRHATW